MVGVFLYLNIGYKIFFYFDGIEERKQIEKYREIPRLSEQEKMLLKNGDILLRRGFGIFSDMIAEDLNSSDYDVSHAGILYQSKDGWMVIHSLSSDVSKVDGVQMQPLDSFLYYSQPKKIIVSRLNNINDSIGNKIVERALYYLGKNVPFDHQGDYKNSDKLFCTELIWQILIKDIKILSPVFKNKKDTDNFYYKLDVLYDGKYFTPVINQFPK